MEPERVGGCDGWGHLGGARVGGGGEHPGAGHTAIYEAAGGGASTLNDGTDDAFHGGPQVVNSLAAAAGSSCGLTGTTATCVYAATQGNGLYVVHGQ